ncbi:MAG TPA: hypothetical protein VKB72_13785 [Steroidobacteraceae bacterium]|nr:hypothetical protein [Steroidobacteraceae bacterium]
MGTGRTCFLLVSAAFLLAGTLTTARAADSPERGVVEISRCQTIDQPGSYIVVTNLKATGDCLVITADNVTVDLNGFTLTGNGSGTGIKGPPQPLQGGVAAFSTTVRNGQITHFARATDLTGTLGATVEGVHAVSNGDGIVLAVGTVKGCFALFNTGKGISLFDGLVSGNIVVGNGTGVTVTEAAVVTGNEVSGNTTGIDAIGLGSGLSHNVVDGNKEVGLQVQCPANLSNNTALGNGPEKFPTNLVLIGKKCLSSDNLAP